MTDNKQVSQGTAKLVENHQRRIRAVVAQNFKVMCQPGSLFDKTKTQSARRGLDVHETPHFLFAHEPAEDKIIIVHRFTLEEIDNNIGYHLMRELSPLELMISDHAFGAALIGVVVSTLPDDPVKAWDCYSLNTLQRLRENFDDTSLPADQEDFITAFAHIYRRLFSLKVGSSLLDVGCACAFWPILVAERSQGAYVRIVGVDSRSDAINLSNNLAARTNMLHVKFIQSDLMTPEFTRIGSFDTVTAIALLEHLSEDQMPQAFSNLLAITRHRLLISVPYEEQPEVAYGHQQVFTPEKLEHWGQWCVEQLQGKGRYWCEEVMGGLLVIERE
jgi:SAM-dependent methyltransferase